MKLVGKIVVQNVAGITTVGCVSLIAALLSINHGFDRQVKTEMGQLSSNLLQDAAARQHEARIAASALAVNPELVKAVEAKDAPKLRELARAAQEQAGVSVVMLLDSGGQVLARSHSDAKGDTLQSESVRRALQGELASGFEKSADLQLGTQIVYPLRKDGRVIGCVLAGYSLTDSDQFVDIAKQRYGVECTIFDGDTRARTTILRDGKRVVGTKMDNPKVIEDVLKQGRPFMGRNAILNQNYDTAYLPLPTVGGAPIGMLFVGQPRAHQEAMVFGIIKWSLLTNVAVCVLACIWSMISARRLAGTIQRVVALVRQGTEEVAHASGHISSSSQSLAEDASEQAASIQETSASLEEMSSMTQHRTAGAQKTAALAKDARQAADKGAADMARMNDAIAALKSSSDEIAKIIKTIDEVAFQTSILALNAAVEAARAGEAGMGFAVVAEEVRNLAQRSATAAKETASRIQAGIASTNQGVEITKDVRASLDRIVSMVHQVDELVADMNSASTQQNQGISQINTAVSQMDKVTQNVAAQAEETASAAQELSSQTERLRQAAQDLEAVVDGSARSKSQDLPLSDAEREKHAFTAAPESEKNGHTKKGRRTEAQPEDMGFEMPPPRELKARATKRGSFVETVGERKSFR